MAAIQICHCFQTKTSSSRTPKIPQKNDHRTSISVSCRSRGSSSSNPVDAEDHQVAKEEKTVKKTTLRHHQVMMMSVDKFGKELRENLSPKQKGDWKDLTYMCLSFALYVYISQKLVCAYCAWTSITKLPW
ncbi:OLC1v1001455C1 [Oldenlandia corymbosa var. corymbosa]|uniref:OLC1v1001455C1 n=1 Tax=Oldenlandia corymbosa var. corymbosa TaxID=529605 RepID=A0AAV1D6F5_OLDCO|nr:OLC1v1001455C1 [Oldenlandia corymbosa var. corymbosa]